MSKLPPGNPLNPVFKARYDFEWLRVFTRRERIAILFRSNFRLQATFFTTSHMGSVQPVFVGGITVAQTPEQQAESSAREKNRSGEVDIHAANHDRERR